MGFRGGVNLTPPQRILVFKYPSRDRVKTISGPSAAAIWTGQGAGRCTATSPYIEAVKPLASMSDVYSRGFGVGQKWSIVDFRRSKNKPSCSV